MGSTSSKINSKVGISLTPGGKGNLGNLISTEISSAEKYSPVSSHLVIMCQSHKVVPRWVGFLPFNLSENKGRMVGWVPVWGWKNSSQLTEADSSVIISTHSTFNYYVTLDWPLDLFLNLKLSPTSHFAHVISPWFSVMDLSAYPSRDYHSWSKSFGSFDNRNQQTVNSTLALMVELS